jgi:regulator of ribonuclease activity A
MSKATSDLCDRHGSAVTVLASAFRRYGGLLSCHGVAEVVRTAGNVPGLRALLDSPGEGRILVIDVTGDEQVAVFGERMATAALDNGWTGVIIKGRLRDSDILRGMSLGVWALGTDPRRGTDREPVERNAILSFDGAKVRTGDYLYADGDGILVTDKPF